MAERPGTAGAFGAAICLVGMAGGIVSYLPHGDVTAYETDPTSYVLDV